MSELRLLKHDRQSAARAWQTGGTLALGHWLAHYKPRFSTQDYAALVALVRAELGDTTDYSKE